MDGRDRHSSRMVAPKRILLAAGGLLAGIAVVWWGVTPRLNNRFSIGELDEPTRHANVSSAGLAAGTPISNSFVPPEPMQSGRFITSGSLVTTTGERQQYTAVFRQGPWFEVAHTLLERDVQTGFGSQVMHYAIQVQGAITADGSQWFFNPVVTGSGPGGEFQVLAQFRFFPMSRGLTLVLTEQLGSETPRSYTVLYDVDLDGEVHRRDR